MNLDFLQHKLDERINKGNIRKLPSLTGLVDFVSNDYLGLSGNEHLATQIHDRCVAEKVPNGGTGSRLLSGNHKWYEEAEDLLKSIFKAEDVLLFNSGYAANQALVSSVADKGDTILYDQLSHVCLKEGAWLSRAETIAFRHNDLEDLESRLKRVEGRCFVLTETIFSMDGDVAPLEQIVSICEKYSAYLIVDEAHSTGVYGENGSGMLTEMKLDQRVLGVILVAVLIAAATATYTVNERSSALVLRFGDPVRVINEIGDDEAGLHFKLPWEEVLQFDRRNVEFDMRPQQLQAGDQ